MGFVYDSLDVGNTPQRAVFVAVQNNVVSSLSRSTMLMVRCTGQLFLLSL